MNPNDGDGCPDDAQALRKAELLAALAGQAWRAMPTSQRMADGTVLRTYGVQASNGAWLGKAHALGATDAERAAAHRHAMMFAASREMFHLLREAVDAFSAEFDGTATYQAPNSSSGTRYGGNGRGSRCAGQAWTIGATDAARFPG